MKNEHLADWIEAKAKAFLAKADNPDPSTDHIRYRHYAQASFLLANEIRAGMHLEDVIEATEPAQ